MLVELLWIISEYTWRLNMTQCEWYPKHPNNQYGNCRGSVEHCSDHKKEESPHDHWLCTKHYSNA